MSHPTLHATRHSAGGCSCPQWKKRAGQGCAGDAKARRGLVSSALRAAAGALAALLGRASISTGTT